MMTGNLPHFSIQSVASFMSWTTMLCGMSSPILSIAFLNFSRSSPFSMASSLAPMSSTPYFLRIPSFESLSERFSPVCPPSVGKRASGRSLAMIFSRTSGVRGSI